MVVAVLASVSPLVARVHPVVAPVPVATHGAHVARVAAGVVVAAAWGTVPATCSLCSTNAIAGLPLLRKLLHAPAFGKFASVRMRPTMKEAAAAAPTVAMALCLCV